MSGKKQSMKAKQYKNLHKLQNEGPSLLENEQSEKSSVSKDERDKKNGTLEEVECIFQNLEPDEEELELTPEELARLERIQKQMDNPIKVTVVCVTYNHEEYIRECLDSIVSQKTTFPFQVYVGEDCGPDNTAAIVREFAEKYPDIVVPFIREENMGSIRNFGDLCSRVQTQYIAFCDGDDYWTDEYKLQKQFDCLEENPELMGCACKAEVIYPDDWHLKDYYKSSADGKKYWPDCMPGFKLPENGLIGVPTIINNHCTFTGCVFFRWDINLEFPEWYFSSWIGDIPLFLMLLGKGKLKFLLDVMVVYRRSNVGITMAQDTDLMFIKTRPDYIKYLYGCRDYFFEHYDGYAHVVFENRIKQEIANYFGAILRAGDVHMIADFINDFPDAAEIGLSTYLNFYWDSRRMTGRYTWEGNKAVARDPYFMRLIAPIVKKYVKLKSIRNKLRGKLRTSKTLKRIKNMGFLVTYWLFAIVPKDKNLWVFSAFRRRGYLDNSKYYYEWLLEHHPEIKPVWLTVDNAVYGMLNKKGRPVFKMNSLKGIWAMARAEIAVTDHFRMTDYVASLGYNHKTKLVQLWHGVGLKSMGDGTTVKNTNVPGVQYCGDILPVEGDSKWEKIKKRFKYFRRAHYRELFEEYFLLVCPGQERIDMIGKAWNIPEDRYFMAGHPRNLPLYQSLHNQNLQKEEIKILYAPTYRFNPKKESEIIEELIENMGAIQEVMQKNNSIFTIRLHPHTWRNYRPKIKKKIFNYDRIKQDITKDAYETLGEYDIIITDYSSVAYDLLMLNRPAVFFVPDYDWFCENEAGFNLDFFEMTPGPKTYTWEETLQEVEKYIKDPQKDTEWRQRVCKYFFNPEVNDEHNSERITAEIKRRLGI